MSDVKQQPDISTLKQTHTMQAVVKTARGHGHVTVKEMPRPEAGPGEILVRVRAAGICGSDLHIYDDAIKSPIRTPVIMGHEFSGEVVEVGDGVDDFAPGDRVCVETTSTCCDECEYCKDGRYNLCTNRHNHGYWDNGCFAEYMKASTRRAYHLPPHISYEEGALCEPLACAVHAVTELTPIREGELVAVLGPGPIGLLTQLVVQAEGGDVIMISTPRSAPRLKMAEKLGAAFTFEIGKDNVVEAVNDITHGLGVDTVFECAGSPQAVDMGFELVKRGGRFMLQGLFGRPIDIDFDKVVFKEIIVSGALGHKRSTWETAIQYLAERRVNVADLVTQRLPLAQWQKGFDLTRGIKGRENIKVMFTP